MPPYPGKSFNKKSPPAVISGKRHGLLVAIKPARRKKWGLYWLCKCDCGKTSEVLAGNFNKTKSCGCQNHKIKHGFSRRGQPGGVHAVWAAMLQRCGNKNNKHFKDYGGRGITVCSRWFSFENFLKDMGDRSSKTTLERKDNQKGYSPDNCKWATRAEQSRNKRTTRLFTWERATKCLSDWARHFGIHERTLHKRLASGLSFEEAINRPYGKGNFITFRGQTKNTSAWAREVGLKQATLQRRFEKGWPVERALQEKVRG